MKKLLLTGLLLGVAGAQAADPNFDFWNKTDKTLHFQLGTEATPPNGKDLIDLGPSSEEGKTVKGRLTAAAKFFGKKATGAKATAGESFYQTTIDTSGKTLILLTDKDSLNTGDKAVLITVKKPGRTVYIRIKPDSSGNVTLGGQKYLVGPQTGPLGGLTGKSERGLPLNNNVTQNDLAIDQNYTVQ